VTCINTMEMMKQFDMTQNKPLTGILKVCVAAIRNN
jgi:hypothetical protein